MDDIFTEGGNDKVLITRILECYRKPPAKPVYDLEPWYENNTWRQTPVDDYEMRLQAYQSLLAGGAGFTYGNKNLWAMSRPRAEDREAWKQALDDPGRLQMQHLHSFLAAYPQDRHPDLEQQFVVASPDSLHQTKRLKHHIAGALSADRRLGFVYSPEGKPFTIDLGALVGVKKSAIWFDPRFGSRLPIVLADSGRVVVTPPAPGRDWLLVIGETDSEAQ